MKEKKLSKELHDARVGSFYGWPMGLWFIIFFVAPLVIIFVYSFLKKGVYKNSNNFCKTVNEARKYEKSSDKLIIIAGACQSDYESLLKSGATFASSPKRINIHALDPAIIATSLSLLDRNKNCDLKSLLGKTKYGKDGIGGLISKGTMYTGYPRSEA